jgi:A/G-specific adenine glycosylase
MAAMAAFSAESCRILQDSRLALRGGGSCLYVVCVATPHQRKISAIVSKLLDWYPKNARDLPWRRTKDPYGVFVSEIMLHQTQVKTVIPYFERWMDRLPTIKTLAEASSKTIHKLWEGLGYYSRVRNLQRAAQVILAKHGGVFPDQFEAVLDLPGVGRYTAGAVCSIAFNQPRAILDGNVIRVLARLFGVAGDPRRKRTNDRLWRVAEDLVSAAAAVESKNCSLCNQSLMELGALICTPKQPQCAICPLNRYCVARVEQRVDKLPGVAPRPPVSPRRFMAFVLESNGRFLVRQRPARAVNAFLWEFPNVEVEQDGVDARSAARVALGKDAGPLEPLCVIKHSITRYRITLEAFAGASQRPAGLDGQWSTQRQLLNLPFSSAHKKILLRLPRPRRRSILARTPKPNHSGRGKKGTGI